MPLFTVDLTWPFPNFSKSHKLWALGSALIIPAVGIVSRIMSHWFNKFKIYNREVLIDALDKRPKSRPLITISNHHSCLDDPVLWGGMLDWRHLLNPNKMRWSLAAHDICFTNEYHAVFFGMGRTVPIIRGNGVYQRAMDFVVDQLNKGEWVHIFPEGKINMTKEFMRFKWGVGRLISECKECPIVIPIYHLGMDNVLPNETPYVPRIGNQVTVVIGKPIDVKDIVSELREKNASPMEQRKKITDIIQEEVWKLRDIAQTLHPASS